MRTTAAILIALLISASALAQVPAEPGPSGTCARLWIERNGIFADRGYCHPSALGQAQFDLSNCRFQESGDAPLTATDLVRIETIRAEENRLGCRIDLTATSADQAARRLVTPPGRDALICNESATPVNLRRGPTATTEVVARLPQGTPVHVLRRVFNPQGSHHWLEVQYRAPDGGEGRGFIYHELVAPRCEGFPDPTRPTTTAAALGSASDPASQQEGADPQPRILGDLRIKVRIDSVIQQLESAIENENHNETLDQIDELRGLVLSLDEIDLFYFEANAAFHLGEMQRAQSALEHYLRASPRDSAVYEAALVLKSQVEERTSQLASGEVISRAEIALVNSFEKGLDAYDSGDFATAMGEWLPLAEQGNGEAQYSLGFMYEQGKGVAQDYAEAVRWYRLAAEQGHTWAQYTLGFMSEHGEGMLQDYAKSAHWYHLAAERGHADSQLGIGSMYERGLGLPQDYAEAARWYRRAAEQGLAIAQTNLSLMYGLGRGVPQDDAEAVRWLRLSAEQGHADAQNYLGLMHEHGRGVPQRSDAEAVHWYLLAAEQGHADAQNALGFMYERGNGVQLDNAEAARWYRLAAEQGHADAQRSLGAMYQHGLGLPQNDAEAARWYALAAEQRPAEAQNNLDAMYERGQQVPQEHAKADVVAPRLTQDEVFGREEVDDLSTDSWTPLAKQMYERAQQGDANAQGALGNMYMKGSFGVPQDDGEALRWTSMSAEQGNAASQHNLGVMYRLGQGVPQDYRKALRWFRTSAVQGNALAPGELAHMLLEGEGVPQDYAEALYWARRGAAALDYIALAAGTKSPYVIGRILSEGLGVAQDKVVAYLWFEIDARSTTSIVMSADSRDRLAQSMTAAELSDARHLINQCFDSNFRPSRCPTRPRRTRSLP